MSERAPRTAIRLDDLPDIARQANSGLVFSLANKKDGPYIYIGEQNQLVFTVTNNTGDT